MALRVYPIVLDPNTSSTRTFDPNNDILVINGVGSDNNDAVAISILNDVKGLIYLNSSDTNLDYIENKIDDSYFIVNSTNDKITLKDSSITADKIASNVDVSSKAFNADLIDGYHASEFARLTENNTFSGENVFQSDVTIESNLQVRGNTYENYAATLNFHGSLITLNFNQGATNPTYSGIEISRGSGVPSYMFVYDSENECFVGRNSETGERLYIEVPDPVKWHHPVTLQYVSQQMTSIGTSYLKLDGTNSPRSDVDFDGYGIKNLKTPSDDSDAVTKKYVDDSVSACYNSISGNTFLKLDGTNSPTANIDWDNKQLEHVSALTLGPTGVTSLTEDIWDFAGQNFYLNSQNHGFGYYGYYFAFIANDNTSTDYYLMLNRNKRWAIIDSENSGVDGQGILTDNTGLRLDGTNSPFSDIDWNGHKITNLADPVDSKDAVTKSYIDNKTEALPIVSEVISTGSSSVEICDIPANRTVKSVTLLIDSIYDSSEITGIEIGDNSSPAVFMTYTENDAFSLGGYTTWPYIEYSSSNKVILNFVGGIPTTGSLRVVVDFI